MDQKRMIGIRLTQMNAPVTAREDTINILNKTAPNLVVLWRTESDTSHAGAVGRGFQRGKEALLGGPAENWRKALVVNLAVEAMLRIAIRVLHVLGVDDKPLQEFAGRATTTLAETQAKVLPPPEQSESLP